MVALVLLFFGAGVGLLAWPAILRRSQMGPRNAPILYAFAATDLLAILALVAYRESTAGPCVPVSNWPCSRGGGCIILFALLLRRN